MSNFQQTGIKISQYQTAQVNDSLRPNKLTLEHFLISYAPTYFGSTTINKNFKIPVSLLRDDLTGYIGIKNAKTNWRNTIKIWSGDWFSNDPLNSYITTWDDSLKLSYPHDYVENKHNDEQNYDKIFIIQNAPLPQTDSSKEDPNPDTKKIMTREYIDNRFNGIPKIQCSDENLEIRSYPCVYVYDTNNINSINIKDTLIDERGNNFMNLLKDKCLEFIIKVATSSVHYDNELNSSDFKITHNDINCKWGFRNELLYMIYKAMQENSEYIWIKCFAEYIDDNFVVKCTNALNVLENEIIIGAAGVVTEIDETYNGKEVPTEEAVVKYVTKHTGDSDIHVTSVDKANWNNTAANSINDISLSDSYLAKGIKYKNTLELGINASQSISDDNTTIPTTKAVYDYVEDVQKSYNEEIDRIDRVLGGIASDLNSEEYDKGIKIIQENGVITSLTVTPASVENGELVEATKDNVITGGVVKSLLDSKIQEISQAGLNYKIVSDLPAASSSEKGWIYLIPSSEKQDNVYIEFICIDKDDNGTWAWEQIGTTKADLTDYTNHINNNNIHITSDERTTWNNKVSEIIQGDYITVQQSGTERTISVNVSDTIEDNESTVIQTKPVYDALISKTTWERDLKGYIGTGESVTKETDTSGNSGQGNYGGLCFVFDESLVLHSITLKEVYYFDGSSSNTQKNCYIKIFTQNSSGEWYLVANSAEYQSEIITNTTNTSSFDHTWSVQSLDGSDFVVLSNKEYHVTFDDNNDVDSYVNGHYLRLGVYQSNSTNNYVLSNNNNLTHTSTNYNANLNFLCELTEEQVVGKETGVEEKIPSEFYGEYLNNHHDISYKHSNTNDIVSFQDGIVTTTDGKTYRWNIQPAMIGNYTFRQKSGQTPSLNSFNPRSHFDMYIGNSTYRNDFYYEYDVFNNKVYDNDLDNNGVPKMSTLQNLVNGSNMFLRSGLTEFNDDLSCLINGWQMFNSSSNLSSFRSSLPSLTIGIRMFLKTSLAKFETKLPHLVFSECMFKDCSLLTQVNTCLPNLTHAQGMFAGCSALSKVRFSPNSFQCLYNGEDMFNGCSSLTSFHYELPYLETGVNMFLSCKLDLESVRIIANSLPDFGTKDSDGYAEDGRKHVITFGVMNTEDTMLSTYKTTMEVKGWVVEGLNSSNELQTITISNTNNAATTNSDWITDLSATATNIINPSSFTATDYTNSFYSVATNIGNGGSYDYELTFKLAQNIEQVELHSLSVDFILYSYSGAAQTTHRTLSYDLTLTSEEETLVSYTDQSITTTTGKITGAEVTYTGSAYNSDGSINSEAKVGTPTFDLSDNIILTAGNEYKLTIANITKNDSGAGTYVGIGNINFTASTSVAQ